MLHYIDLQSNLHSVRVFKWKISFPEIIWSECELVWVVKTRQSAVRSHNLTMEKHKNLLPSYLLHWPESCCCWPSLKSKISGSQHSFLSAHASRYQPIRKTFSVMCGNVFQGHSSEWLTCVPGFFRIIPRSHQLSGRERAH